MTDTGAKQEDVTRVEARFTRRLADIEREELSRLGAIQTALAGEAKKVDGWYSEERDLHQRVHRDSVGDAKREYGVLKRRLRKNHEAAIRSLEDHLENKLKDTREEKQDRLAPLEDTMEEQIALITTWKATTTKEAEVERQEQLDAIKAEVLGDSEQDK